ncbi:zona pellucida sperm-binding protein 3-like [Danio aesculapii]|uniref:zona pellucida sperm-binding protein 3-like n=1 Tax=Danio aesculapii TaxID=1142201 RepID=UPI0024C0902D|nr:zona pellucida sperm-binding protein 3-like [Danio aesculapii]
MPVHVGKPFQSQELVIQPQQWLESFSENQKVIPGPNLYPVLTEEVVMEPVFQPEVPVPANSVEARCEEASVKIHVQQNFFGSGQLIEPSDLTLGGCPFVGFDDRVRIIAFESALEGCGSLLTMTDDSLVYAFALVYSPSPVPNTPVDRTNEATVPIYCIYPRKHNVSSNALLPNWTPYSAVGAGEEHLQFSLRLMTDDWQYERPSNTFFMGDLINVEASIIRANHAPLRVFVESCVASLGPIGEANIAYMFIQNHGCMVDARMTHSRSRFMSRIQDDKLRFQIESFRFQQDSSGLIYITCHLKATTTFSPVDMMHKACSFATETQSWIAADGDNQVCGCCESTCTFRKARSLDTRDSMFEDDAAIGPIVINKVIGDHSLPQTGESSEMSSKDAESSMGLALITGLVAVGILCIIILGALFYQRRQKRQALTCE